MRNEEESTAIALFRELKEDIRSHRAEDTVTHQQLIGSVAALDVKVDSLASSVHEMRGAERERSKKALLTAGGTAATLTAFVQVLAHFFKGGQ